jgi:hypothetical protein
VKELALAAIKPAAIFFKVTRVDAELRSKLEHNNPNRYIFFTF